MEIEFTSPGQLIEYLKAGLAFLDMQGKHLAAAYLAQAIEVLSADLGPPEPDSKSQ